MQNNLKNHPVVSEAKWIEARKQLLKREKELTQLREKLAQERRELPWVKVEQKYLFQSSKGEESLSDLFGGKSQLVIYHFMFAPGWEEGCKSCSFWADNFNGIDVHLNNRDASFIAISRAQLEKLAAYKKRLGWDFKWVSSGGNTFNFDYGVSFTPEQIANGGTYNYVPFKPWGEEAPGISVFFKDQTGSIFHTYSTFGRGLDMMNGAYQYLDLTPKGRDENPESPQEWVRRNDEYGDVGSDGKKGKCCNG